MNEWEKLEKKIARKLLRNDNLRDLYGVLTQYVAEGKIEPDVYITEQHDNAGGTVMAVVSCTYNRLERQMLLCKRSDKCLAIAFMEEKQHLYGIDAAGASANVQADWIRKLLLKHYDKLQLVTCPNQAVRELFEIKGEKDAIGTSAT